MSAKGKKNVSPAYKKELLAAIAHYDKRMEEALETLNKRKHFVPFRNESFEDIVTNPYAFKLQPSKHELTEQEASLTARGSRTLELANLTIIESEDNIMITAPEVRKPVPEDGVWHDVVAECKIDLISFAITFYAHKPHRKFGPTRYRNLTVTLAKSAHQKELDRSILPKLHLPNLALQVLQSYATAFRSRRTTLLELAEEYADKLRMQAMPAGGYRVSFLDLVQLDWTLENHWSPILPFCHRMKFNVEYMPEDYVQEISKLYKQINPSLETSERTLILSRIFDVCLQASGPASELQESFESDPETAGRLHERRTTMDHEPDVPDLYQSPKKKDPIGKENKPQNRKTSMAPPKTIPKKAKKSKPNERDVIGSRKSVKRAIESESCNASKKSRTDDSGISKSKPGLKGGGVISKDGETADAVLKTKDTEDVANNRETVAGVENNVQKKSGKVSAKHTKDTDSADTATKENYAMKKRDGKTIKSKGSGVTEGDGDINNAKNNKDVGSEASSKGSKKEAKTKDKVTKSKDMKIENNIAWTKKSADNIANINNDKNVENNVVTSKKVVENKTNTQNEISADKNTVKSKDFKKENATGSKKGAESTVNKKVANAKKDECGVASSKAGTKRSEHGDIVNSKEKIAVTHVAVPKIRATNKEDRKNAANTKVNSTEDELTGTIKGNNTDTVRKTSSKTVDSKDDDGKIKAVSKKLKDTNKADIVSKKVPNNAEKEANVDAVGSVGEVNDKTKSGIKKPTQKATNTVKQKEVGNSVDSKNVKDKNEKQTEKAVVKNKVAKEKSTETEKKIGNKGNNKEKHLAEKWKVTKPKGTEQNKITGNKTKTNLVRPHKSAQNAVLANDGAKNIKNNDNQPNKTTADKKQKSKSNARPQTATIVLKENSNLQKAVLKTKIPVFKRFGNLPTRIGPRK